MAQFAGVCRLVWNLALEQRRDHWKLYQEFTGDQLTYVAQARELTDLRAEFAFISDVHVTPLQRILKSLDDAYRRAWKGSVPASCNTGSTSAPVTGVNLARMAPLWSFSWAVERRHASNGIS